jgi:hypothetical protein
MKYSISDILDLHDEQIKALTKVADSYEEDIKRLEEQVLALQHIADRDEETLDKYRGVVYYICNDYHELSREKAMVQRDDWKKMCRQLRDEMENK